MSLSVLKGITVDGETSRDLDDGFFVQETKSGWNVSVFIAHPTSDSISPKIFQDALSRGASEYLKGGVVKNMLPREDAEHTFSLLPEHDPKETLCIKMDINKSGKATLKSVTLESFVSMGKLTYLDVSGERDLREEVLEQVKAGVACAQALYSSRLGNITTEARDILDSNFEYISEEGVTTTYSPREIHGQILVQELMIVSNSLLSSWAIKNNIPILFRNHEKKKVSSIVSTNENVIDLYSQLDKDELDQILPTLFKQATYSFENKGHAGLDVSAYTHITSPIRRFPDLYNHFAVRAYLTGGSYPELSSDRLKSLNDRLLEIKGKSKDDPTNESQLHKAHRRLFKNMDISVRKIVEVFKLSKSNKAINLASNRIIKEEKLYCTPRVWASIIAYKPNIALKNADKLMLKFVEQENITLGILASLKNEFPALLSSVEKSGGVKNALCEALFLDKERYVMNNEFVEETVTENFKGKLLEYCQTNKLPTPEFEGSSSGEAHALIWTVKARLNIEPCIEAEGISSSKKNAEQLSCREILAELSDKPLMVANTPIQQTVPSGNYKGQLFEYCQSKSAMAPIFETVNVGEPHLPVWVTKCNTTIDGVQYTSESRTTNKKASEQMAAKVVLEKLPAIKEKSPAKPSSPQCAKSALNEACLKFAKTTPSYKMIKADLSHNEPQFQCEVTVFWNDTKITTKGQVCRNKKLAEKSAAAEMLANRIAHLMPSGSK
ncbi:TPA: RNB domain-containing ribonuclease [Vibrio parahaemolyticus]